MRLSPISNHRYSQYKTLTLCFRIPATIGVELMSLLFTFIYLQVLDLLTTLLGFRLGAAEASPFIRVLMHAGPAVGVILSKVCALGLAGFCLYLKKEKLIRWISYWYGGLVVWNLVVILHAPGLR